jgi:predicted TIM-barrel fold metal-dependent hydrolase
MPTTLDWVIDSDTHITEPPDVWTSRLPAKYRDQAPRIVHDKTWDWDIWQIGESRASITVGHTAVAGWKEPFPAAPKRFEDVPKAAHDANARLAYMDSIGVWAMALYPNVGGFGNEAFLKLDDPELMLACVRAYNDFLIDWISPDPRRFISILATPFWDPEGFGARDRAPRRGTPRRAVHGEPRSKFSFRSSPIRTGTRSGPRPGRGSPDQLPHRQRQPHGGVHAANMKTYGISRSTRARRGPVPRERQPARRPAVLGRARARFPKLEVVSVESGIGFIPFILEAADYAFGEAAMRRERPEFELLPSEYFQRQVYGCWFFEETAPQRLVDKIGAGNILFETDYPHPVCLYGNVREKIDAALAGHPPGRRASALGRTPRSLQGARARPPWCRSPIFRRRAPAELASSFSLLEEYPDRRDVFGRTGLLFHGVFRLERGADPVAVRAKHRERFVAWSADPGCWAISRCDGERRLEQLRVGEHARGHAELHRLAGLDPMRGVEQLGGALRADLPVASR